MSTVDHHDRQRQQLFVAPPIVEHAQRVERAEGGRQKRLATVHQQVRIRSQPAVARLADGRVEPLENGEEAGGEKSKKELSLGDRVILHGEAKVLSRFRTPGETY